MLDNNDDNLELVEDSPECFEGNHDDCNDDECNCDCHDEKEKDMEFVPL